MSGIKNAWHKTPNMDTLVTLGVTSSFLFSLVYSFAIWQGQFHYVHQLYYESVVMIVYFMKLGRLIDKKSKEKTKLAIQELVQVTPTKALVKEGEELREVTIDEVHPHDQLVAKPGMKIAVDGVITKGETHLEEAFITGESVPVKKTIGEEVIAGSMNVDGYIEYEAKRIGKDSTISEIVRLVVEATNTKAPIGRLADRVSSYFVPIVIGIAFLTGIGYLVLENSISTSMNAFVTVLVVACPCALGLSTPLAMVVSVGNCAKSGILIKSSEILERAHKVSVVVFDKTGTLTYGNLKVDTTSLILHQILRNFLKKTMVSMK